MGDRLLQRVAPADVVRRNPPDRRACDSDALGSRTADGPVDLGRYRMTGDELGEAPGQGIARPRAARACGGLRSRMPGRVSPCSVRPARAGGFARARTSRRTSRIRRSRYVAVREPMLGMHACSCPGRSARRSPMGRSAPGTPRPFALSTSFRTRDCTGKCTTKSASVMVSTSPGPEAAAAAPCWWFPTLMLCDATVRASLQKRTSTRRAWGDLWQRARKRRLEIDPVAGWIHSASVRGRFRAPRPYGLVLGSAGDREGRSGDHKGVGA